MAVAQFKREYTTVRRAEGWGSSDGAYYRALPYQDLTGRFPGIWRIRARSYDTFVRRVLEPMEVVAGTSPSPAFGGLSQRERRFANLAGPAFGGLSQRERRFANLAGRAFGGLSQRERRFANLAGPGSGDGRGDPLSLWERVGVRGSFRALDILDLGAGCGWLSYRLALRGHAVIAIDLMDDPLDGLGASRHYANAFTAALAEYDHLPLPSREADVVVFNASLHYSTDFAKTLSEALRVLREEGTLVILDSPMYVDPTSGQRMVQERQARFLATYGFASDALPSEHFVTPARLAELADELNVVWEIHTPALDWRTTLGRTISGLRARREPARFPVIVGKRR